MKNTALLPGTFDPFTVGHLSLVKRSLSFMDEIIIAIGINEAKRSYFPLEKRLEMIARFFKDEPRIKVDSYDSLTVDYALKNNARYIIRGMRTVNDFEYEKSIADTNKALSGVETIALFTEPEYTHISSTVVRELLRYGKDISSFIPEGFELIM